MRRNRSKIQAAERNGFLEAPPECLISSSGATCARSPAPGNPLLVKVTTQTPRSVSGIILALGILWGALSLFFLFLGLRSIQAERRFQAESVSVPGIIASKRVHEKNGIDPSTKTPTVSRTYYLTATFTDDRGKKREVETSVSAEQWESAREDEAVKVSYLPTAPAKSRIAGESQLGGAWFFTGLGSFGLVIGLWVGLSGLRKRRGIRA